jgi:hypothetical protein
MSLLGIGTAVGAIGGVASSASKVIEKIGDIVLVPANLMSDWAKEPLKRKEFDRKEIAKDNDVRRDVERQVGVERVLSEQRIKEEDIKTNLAIKKETEIVKIIAEIEQLKKDKEFERMKTISDALMDYQIELTRINVEAVEAIGSMRIELQRKAYDLIHEKTEQYNNLQKQALDVSLSQLERIDSSNLGEASKIILIKAVDANLSTIIKNAQKFLEQLNDDMRLISSDINLITSSGQQFIQRHLEQFQLIGFSTNTQELLETKNE